MPRRRRCRGSCVRGPTRCGIPGSPTAPWVRGKPDSGWRSPLSGPTATTRCRGTRRCVSEIASKTISCDGTSRPMRWRCESPPTVRGNSSIHWVDLRRCGSGSWTPRPPRRCPSPMIRFGCCVPPGSSHNLSSEWPTGCVRPSSRWRPSWLESPSSGWPSSSTRCCWVRIRWRVSS